jgi:hypothetical protein
MWINDPPSESSEDEDMAGVGAPDIFVKADNVTDGMYGANNHNKQPELTEEELEKVNVLGCRSFKFVNCILYYKMKIRINFSLRNKKLSSLWSVLSSGI